MAIDKRTTLSDAIDSIEPGSTVAMGLALEHAIPFAAGHELIRQGISDLTMVGPISDMLFDQLIGGNIVEGIIAAWVGNVSVGSGYRFRDAVEGDSLDVVNHSNLSLALALEAGRLNVPSLPTRSLVGSDILEEGPFVVDNDPVSGERLVYVPALQPDWTIVHAQRASPSGDVHLWGNTGVTEQAVGAAEHVIVTVEEIVDDAVIRSDPSRVTITRDLVDAVVEVPFGAHPAPLTGYYRRDHDHFLQYAERTREQSGFEAWRTTWIDEMTDRQQYLERIETDLTPLDRSPAAEVRYGR